MQEQNQRMSGDVCVGSKRVGNRKRRSVSEMWCREDPERLTQRGSTSQSGRNASRFFFIDFFPGNGIFYPPLPLIRDATDWKSLITPPAPLTRGIQGYVCTLGILYLLRYSVVLSMYVCTYVPIFFVDFGPPTLRNLVVGVVHRRFPDLVSSTWAAHGFSCEVGMVLQKRYAQRHACDPNTFRQSSNHKCVGMQNNWSVGCPAQRSSRYVTRYTRLLNIHVHTHTHTTRSLSHSLTHKLAHSLINAVIYTLYWNFSPDHMQRCPRIVVIASNVQQAPSGVRKVSWSASLLHRTNLLGMSRIRFSPRLFSRGKEISGTRREHTGPHCSLSVSRS